MTAFFAVLIAAMTLAGQTPARDQPRTSRAGTGAIRGRVVRADTGEPLRRVQVRIEEWNTKDQGGPAATMTDAQGRYELSELPAGSYHLRATRGGYVEVAYGQRRPFEKGRPVEVTDGAVVQNIDFALPAGGVLTGRVVDEVGEPVAQASVSLARRRYIDGERKLVGQSGSSTDDRGEFRIFGVPPGDYVMIARFNGFDFGSRDRVRYVPTYYPGTPVASDAQPVTVAAGQELSGIIIALARAATSSVHGIIRSSGEPALGPFTAVTAEQVGGQAEAQSAIATAAKDGSFVIAGLLPGTYRLYAQSMFATSEFATKEIVVEGSDLTGVILTLSRGVTVRGRITFDTGKPPDGVRPSDVFIGDILLDHQMSARSMGDPPVAHDDWSFELRGLRGRGFVRAGTLTADWHMKRVRRGDADVTDVPLDFSSDIDDLEIELTQNTTTVSGGVSDDRNAAVVDATIVVFADDPARWGPQSRFVGSARPDQQGRFTVKDLPPGTYIAIAVAYLEPGEERDPDLLQQWRPRGTRFTLLEGETHPLDLKLSGS